MESQDNLPENIKILIQRAVASNSPTLDLRNSGLNDSIIKNVLIKIKEELPNLQNLILSNNPITAVPSEIGNLTNLIDLHLYNTPLTELPSEIVNLTNLRDLHLGKTQLTQLPSEIVNLTNLRDLHLGKTQLPSEIVNLTNLRDQHLGKTQLTQLPSEIVNLTNLRDQHLGKTQLTQLPSEIVNLTNLRDQHLGKTQLTQLPSEIVNLTNLRDQHLGKTQLTQLPSEIGNLANLEILFLENTQLSLKSVLILSKLEVRLVGINNDQRQVHDNLQKEGYSSIVNAFADTYPDISVEDFNTFFLRLSSDQVRGIVDFEVPLQELGIGFDTEGNISTELEVATPTIELNDKIDRIKKSNPDISNEEALNLTKNTEEQTLQGIYDFGLASAQLDQIDSQEMRIDVYKLLIEKIATENHDNETPDIGELTDADKNLARASFDQIIEYYKSQQKQASNDIRDFSRLAIRPSDKVGGKGHGRSTSRESKPSQKEGVKPRGPKMG